jgi:DnaJ-domain-containing protein 1
VTRWLLLALLVLVVVRLLRVRPSRRAVAERGDWDAHAVLGVPRGASSEAVTQAYRDRLKEYHPDRVAGLGRELQELAHRKTVDIQRAYAELTGSGARRSG